MTCLPCTWHILEHQLLAVVYWSLHTFYFLVLVHTWFYNYNIPTHNFKNYIDRFFFSLRFCRFWNLYVQSHSMCFEYIVSLVLQHLHITSTTVVTVFQIFYWASCRICWLLFFVFKRRRHFFRHILDVYVVMT